MKQIYLAYYRDEVSQELLRFKKEYFSSIDRWLNFIDKHFDAFFKDIKVDYIVRALGSDEEQNYPNTPLNLVGELLAKKLNAKYVPNILTKSITDALKSAGGRLNRERILNNTYKCNLGSLKQDATYLIIDDVSTTGTTFKEISRAITEASNHKANIVVFSLVKTLFDKDYTAYKQQYNQKFYTELIA